MTWSKQKALVRIGNVGLVPIIRTGSAEDAWQAAQAIATAGVGIVEITMGVPNALEVIERIVTHYGDNVLPGAGTILDPDTCREAISAGAEFIVAPNFDRRVVEATHQCGKVCIPGALTPTEVLTAHQAGADMIKIFPCGPVGGPQYIRALKGPFPQIDFIPTGGITLDSVPDYIRAGVAAVGVGGNLLAVRASRQGEPDAIRANARALLAAVRSARTASTCPSEPTQ
ncbi:MAG: bifunctional 4-hydroxy-2-oxoglutarate aldolase/2-dehydro-3-deoxy-phosphogluconate aldolase [Candidatus Binatia bacterium]